MSVIESVRVGRPANVVRRDAVASVVEEAEVGHLSHVLCTTLPANGLDRMTPDRIELVICASALTAHI